MKTSIRQTALAGLAALAFVLVPSTNTSAADKEEHNSAIGSIRPSGHFAAADLPALTKITFEAALHAALTAVPGNVIKAELEIEHGNLMYSFEIVTADKKVKEVEIDAGNGKVLDIDED